MRSCPFLNCSWTLDLYGVHICVTCRRPRPQRLLTEEIHRSTRVSYKYSYRAILLLQAHVYTCMVNIALARSVAYWILSEYWRWLNDWSSQAPQLSGDSSPGCTAVYRSLLYPRMRASQITNWKLTIVITMDKFIVKCSRLKVPEQETVPPPPAAGSGTAHTACKRWTCHHYK